MPLARIKSSTCLLLTNTHTHRKEGDAVRHCLFVFLLHECKGKRKKYRKLCFIYVLSKILEDTLINSIVKKVECQASSSIF